MDFSDFVQNKSLELIKTQRDLGDKESAVDNNTREQGNTGDEEDEGEMIFPDWRGPAHTLLKLGYHDKMHTIYDFDIDVISKFLIYVLPDAVGKRKWNKLSKGLRPSKFVTTSDEAFAMIVIENNAVKWLDMLMNPNIRTRERKVIGTKYSQNQEQVGWSIDGIYRFTVLDSIVKTKRKDIILQRKLDDIYSSKFGSNKNKLLKNDKRKLDEYMKNIIGFQNLEETRKIEERRRKKNEQMNNILLNMCMKGGDYDTITITEPEEV